MLLSFSYSCNPALDSEVEAETLLLRQAVAAQCGALDANHRPVRPLLPSVGSAPSTLVALESNSNSIPERAANANRTTAKAPVITQTIPDTGCLCRTQTRRTRVCPLCIDVPLPAPKIKAYSIKPDPPSETKPKQSPKPPKLHQRRHSRGLALLSKSASETSKAETGSSQLPLSSSNLKMLEPPLLTRRDPSSGATIRPRRMGRSSSRGTIHPPIPHRPTLARQNACTVRSDVKVAVNAVYSRWHLRNRRGPGHSMYHVGKPVNVDPSRTHVPAEMREGFPHPPAAKQTQDGNALPESLNRLELQFWLLHQID